MASALMNATIDRLTYSKVEVRNDTEDLAIRNPAEKDFIADNSCLETDDDYDDDYDGYFEEERRSKAIRRKKTAFWKIEIVGVAIATIGTNIYAFLVFENSIQMLACMVALFVSSMVIIYEISMPDIYGYFSVNRELRDLVFDFSLENYRLSQEAEILSVRLFCLNEAEVRLRSLSNDQNVNVRKLCGLVATNQKIIQEKKRLMRLDLVEEVMSLVLASDRDKSGDFSEREVNILIGYVRTLPAITVNESNLRAVITKQKSLNAVLSLVRDIGDHNKALEERVFIINDEDSDLRKAISLRKVERQMKTAGTSGKTSLEKEIETIGKDMVEGAKDGLGGDVGLRIKPRLPKKTGLTRAGAFDSNPHALPQREETKKLTLKEDLVVPSKAAQGDEKSEEKGFVRKLIGRHRSFDRKKKTDGEKLPSRRARSSLSRSLSPARLLRKPSEKKP